MINSGAITIGRNIGSTPMPADLWHQFIGAVQELVAGNGGTIYLTATGTGTWDGITEDSTVITFGDADTDRIAAGLPLLAEVYEQDAIALVTGTSTLVTPTPALIG